MEDSSAMHGQWDYVIELAKGSSQPFPNREPFWEIDSSLKQSLPSPTQVRELRHSPTCCREFHLTRKAAKNT